MVLLRGKQHGKRPSFRWVSEQLIRAESQWIGSRERHLTVLRRVEGEDEGKNSLYSFYMRRIFERLAARVFFYRMLVRWRFFGGF